MANMKPFTSQSAYESARSNAAYFGVPYVVFCDTNGNWRAESYRSAGHVCFAVAMPDGTEHKSTVQTTAGELLRRNGLDPTPESYRTERS
jgi:hypothetical protein